MATLVELELFPCLENPQWILTEKQAGDYNAWHDRALRTANQEQGGLVDSSTLPVVGYTGFKVTVDNKPAERVYKSQIFRERVPSPFDNMEQYLFWTNRVDLREEYGLDMSVLRDDSPARIEDLPETCPMTALNCGPTEFPEPNSKWNCKPFVTNDACYNYANNALTQFRLFPGNVDQVFNISQMRSLLTGDGLTALRDIPVACPGATTTHYIVALLHVLGTSGSYHFLRLDHNGFWTHKNGAFPASNKDEHGVIGDLCHAEFKTKFKFAGFFESNAEAQRLLIRRGRPATTCRP